MRAVLEFDLPDDGEAHLLAVNAGGLYSSLWDLDQELRGKLKHGHTFKDADEALEKVRDELHEIMDGHGVSLDMVS